MSEREAVKVRKNSALESGTPWWNEPFVLPIPKTLQDLTEGSMVRVVSHGNPLALTRVDRIWKAESQFYLAGPIEAVSHGSRVSPSARAIRRSAREQGQRHIACIFPSGSPTSASGAFLEIATALTDLLVVAAHTRDYPAWRSVAETEPEKIRAIRLPDDFPSHEGRARLVVERSVGASVNLHWQ